jgi:hypothetical protein
MLKTLAIFSLNKLTYSETFIQAHKNLDFNIKYYYGGKLPTALEGEPDILKLSFRERIKRRLLKDFIFLAKRKSRLYFGRIRCYCLCYFTYSNFSENSNGGSFSWV